MPAITSETGRDATAPTIAISLGDPCGIGPEIVVAALQRASKKMQRRLVVYGQRAHLERAGAIPDGVKVVDCAAGEPDAVVLGEPNAASGAAQVAYLEAAVAAAAAGDVAALVTAPIHKASARLAGMEAIGHTELLAERLGAADVAMMFAGPRLKVVLATTHIPLGEVAGALTSERVVTVGRLAIESLVRDFGVASPRVGVLGLNPHAGEAGLLGDDEARVIAPAIEALRRELGDAAEIAGPLVPDAAFRQPFDLFVAMYHDQALIPVKLLDFDDSVNVTLGLPIVRTSPDHGVAHDIAGRGLARPDSFIAALELADSMAAARARAG